MTNSRRFKLKLRSRVLALGERTLVMGVLNVTPDSFSDGGENYEAEAAIERGLALERDGADLLDIGAESTRPGAEGISAEEELRRLLPVLQGLKGRLKIPVSIDTRKSEVAEAALEAGAEMVNDVSGLRSDARLGSVAAKWRAPLILMHMRGEPRTMQKEPFARNVVRDVKSELRAAADRAMKAGVAKTLIVVDPGIGFGKSFAQNYELLRRLPEIGALGFPLLVGTSRKAFLGGTLAENGRPAAPRERIWGTAATVTASVLGGAHFVRVHDVKEMAQVVRVADCIKRKAQSGREEEN